MLTVSPRQADEAFDVELVLVPDSLDALGLEDDDFARASDAGNYR